MGKASQAKKAARLARESGEVEQKRKRRLAFPLAVVGAILVGIIVVAIARQPESAPKLEIDPTTVTSAPSASAETTPTSLASDAGGASSTAVPNTVAAGQ
jgi:hypothetical protein